MSNLSERKYMKFLTFDNIHKLITLVGSLGSILFVVLVLWLKINFVSIDTFKEYIDNNESFHRQTTELISQQTTTLAVMSRNEKDIAMLTEAVRRLELASTDHGARINVIEKRVN